MAEETTPRQVIQVNRGIVGPAEPRPRSVRPRKIDDFSGLPKAYADVVERLSSPLLMGPPVCDELVAFVRHLFTEEEAGVGAAPRAGGGHDGGGRCRAEHRPVEQVEPILERLASRSGRSAPRAEGGRDVPADADHARHLRDGADRPVARDDVRRGIADSPSCSRPCTRPATRRTTSAGRRGRRRCVRVLSVGRTIEAHPMALPSDRLEVVLDRFETFGVGQCQCRMTMQVAGQGCGRPLGNCTVMGQWAEAGIEQGWLEAGLAQERAGDQARGRVARAGHVDHERRVEQGAGLVLVLRLLLPRDAVGERVQRPGLHGAGPFPPRFDDAKCTFCGALRGTARWALW